MFIVDLHAAIFKDLLFSVDTDLHACMPAYLRLNI